MMILIVVLITIEYIELVWKTITTRNIFEYYYFNINKSFLDMKFKYKIRLITNNLIYFCAILIDTAKRSKQVV